MVEPDVHISADFGTSGTVDAAYDSFAALRRAHVDLMRGISDSEMDSKLPRPGMDSMRAFLARAQATGAILGDEGERRAAQGILDYWCVGLISAPGASALDFVPARLAPYDKSKTVSFGERPTTADSQPQERTRDIIRLDVSCWSLAARAQRWRRDPRFWSMAPEWLRSHMTLLATPGVIEHSGEEPVAFLAHVGVAWLAVKQETPGGEGSNSVAS